MPRKAIKIESHKRRSSNDLIEMQFCTHVYLIHIFLCLNFPMIGVARVVSLIESTQ